MAIFSALKSFRNELGEEMKEAASLLGLRKTDSGSLGANFRRYGASFGIYDYDDFVAKAKIFFHDAMESDDPYYSVVQLRGGRIAIDFNGEKRGVFTARGKPLAFFRPDFRQTGYSNKNEEIEAFRTGKLAFS